MAETASTDAAPWDVPVAQQIAEIRELLQTSTDPTVLEVELMERRGTLRMAWRRRRSEFTEADLLFLGSIQSLVRALNILEIVLEDLEDVRYRGDAMEATLRLEAVAQYLPEGSLLRGRAEKEARELRQRFKTLPSRSETAAAADVRAMETKLLRLPPVCPVCRKHKRLVHHGELEFSWHCEAGHESPGRSG